MSAEGLAKQASAAPPLVVDLDGTLMRGDVFSEAILRFLVAAPWRIFTLIGWFMKGRAYAKQRLAEAAPFDPADLPYNSELIDWIKSEKARGRTIVLATAADAAAAHAVAEHIGVFDAVFASDGHINLKSAAKAQALVEAYPQGFVYAGNETADLKVWAAAEQAVIVNAPKTLTARAARAFKVEKSFAPAPNGLRAFVKAIRPQQWAKNVLVFVPMMIGQGWADIAAWQNAFIAFWALSFTASSVYIVNDAADIDADRRHARKRRRPFASGALNPLVGVAASFTLLAIGVTLAAQAGALFYILAYLVATTLYTFWLKRVVLVDVFVLAGLYTLRVVLGGVATGYIASGWLLAFSCFFFLSLALVKRVAEVDALAAKGGGALSRRGYLHTDGAILKAMGLSAGFISTLVLALYLQEPSNASQYGEPFLLWATPAAMVFWLCRIWLITERGHMHDDPLVYAFRDRVSWLIGAVVALSFGAAVLLPPDTLSW